MHTVDYNLTLLEEMLAEFEAFLLSKELFWPLQKTSYARTPFPRLSLGSLLLTLDELSAQEPSMDGPQAKRYRQLVDQFESLSHSKQAAIEKKAARELQTRTTLWSAYLQDLEEDPESVEEYHRQVSNRVLISKLSALSGQVPSIAGFDRVKEMDARIAEKAESVDFLWDDRLIPLYPIERYPFLYLKPR